MQCDIVPISESHIAGFHQAVDRVARERKYLAFLQAPPLENARRFVLDNIERRHPQFVAVNDGSVLGWCDVIPNQSRELFLHCGTLGMGLLPGYRGQGIGRRLMAETIAAAWRFGLMRIDLQVRAGNAAAIALYKNAGFEVEGIHRGAVRIDGNFEDLYSMALIAV